MPKVITDAERIRGLLTKNVEQAIEHDHLEAALRSGKRLRVKLGIDPTGTKIHIGRAVVLWKLREFQDLGHQVVLIIGDYTALIGDPSDKLDKRPTLTSKDIEKNLKTYLDQIGLILEMKKVEVRYNSEWLGKLKFEDILRLTDLFTASQMIERRNFKERFKRDEEISLREFMYPLMQGYDSVAVKADVELGGTDQLFNLLAGRKVQSNYGQKPQDILLTSMLLGLDGRKMSTSWGNVVNISDAPDEQFGKLMSMHDDLIVNYFKCVLPSGPRGGEIEKRLKHENPKNVKEDLAREVVKLYHGEAAAQKAAESFEKMFAKKEINAADIPALQVPEGTLIDLVVASKVAASKSEARRLVLQGGIKINDAAVTDPNYKLSGLRGGEILKVGKRHFFWLSK